MSPSLRRLALIPLSASLLLASGCHRDPNVRKQKYLESGKRYETSGKYREATIQFGNALKVDPNFADAHYELANTYLKMGSFNAGYQELLRTVELAPKNARARLDLGNIELAGNLPEQALAQANAVLAANPNNAEAYALLANYWGRKGDRAQATQDIQKALSIDPGQSRYHVILAMLQPPPAPGAPISPDAIQELQKAISLDKNNTEARLLLASNLERQKDFPGAIAQVQQAIQAAPKELRPREMLAALYLQAGNRPDAEHTLRQAADDLPDDPAATGLLSQFYLAQGQLGQADSAYADLVGKHPKSQELKLAYARILVLENQLDKAQTLATELTKDAPNNPQVAILNGSLLLGAGKNKEAADVLQKAISSSPDNFDLRVAYGKVSLKQNNYSEATRSFTEALRIQPRNLDAAAGLAEVADHNRDSAQLIDIANKTIAFAPRFANAYVWRAGGEGMLGQFDKAQADFNAALALDPKSTASLLGLAEIKTIQKQAPAANALYDQALAIDPNSIPALRMLVQADLSAGHPEKALARVQDAISRAPGNESLYVLLSSLQMATKDYNGAHDSAAKAISLNAGDEEPVQLEAQSLALTGNYGGAISVWQGWLDKHPDDAGANTMLGLLEETGGDPTKAVGYYKKAIQLKPGAQSAMASNNLAYFMVEHNQDLDEALQYAQQARQAMPSNPGTADTLAWVYYHKGRYSTAKDLLEGAIRQQPNDAAMQLHLGLTYSKLNDKANAVTHLKKAEELGSNSPVGKAAADALATLS